MNLNYFRFQRAVPIWEKGKQTDMNHTIECFTTLYGKKDYMLYIAGASSYLVFVNDVFVAHGPARTAHGFYKVDEIVLKDFLSEGENLVKIRSVGYNVNSFCYLDQPSFLCAEVRLENEVIAYTEENADGMNFEAVSYPLRIQKVQRYSYQRTFAESYNLSRDCGSSVELERTEDKIFIKRDVPYGEYQRLFPVSALQRGNLTTSQKEEYYNKREITRISDCYKGYPATELEYASHVEYGKLDFGVPTSCEQKLSEIELVANQYIDLDMGKNQTGLVAMELEVHRTGTVFVAFDELMTDGRLDPFRNSSSNIIALHVEEGTYHFISAEPYGMKYVRIAAADCEVTIRDFSLIEIAFPNRKISAEFIGKDEVMQRIFDAAKLSFRANTVDTYMDCPTRERAGWLCDSFFTSRVERVLTGNSVVEKSFLETLLLPDFFGYLPKGMLPMCYPCDVVNKEFIPNWAMWYALELYEYYERTADRELVDNAKSRMEDVLSYFKSFENELGLLKGLTGQVFVDASGSNTLARKRNVSFASNMLYAAFKSVLGILYNRADLKEEAKELRDVIRHYAVTEKGFFRDSADWLENTIVLGEECSEACQYYAFYFKIVTPEECPELWDTMIKDFSYDQLDKPKHPEIAPCNTFIGKYLRLDLLERYGYYNELYNNIRGYFSYMADKTGTLWEYISPTASCNHGFSSHVIYWMDKLGLISKTKGETSC